MLITVLLVGNVPKMGFVNNTRSHTEFGIPTQNNRSVGIGRLPSLLPSIFPYLPTAWRWCDRPTSQLKAFVPRMFSFSALSFPSPQLPVSKVGDMWRTLSLHWSPAITGCAVWDLSLSRGRDWDLEMPQDVGM